MSLEDFTRELQNKPPLNRHPVERWAYTDEDGSCSFDQEAFVTPLHWGVGIAFLAGMLLMGWASGDEDWAAVTGTLQQGWDFIQWLFGV